MSSEARPNPSVIIDLATAYWNSSALFAANRLRIFSAIAAGAATAAEIAGRCEVPVRGMEMLLNACAGLRLIEKTGDRFQNTPAAEAFLVDGRPAYLGSALKYAEDLYPLWGKLEPAIRSGKPPAPPEDILGLDKEKTRNFVLGMHNRAMGIASAVIGGLELAGRKQSFDVGGGPGTYSILMVRKTPGLKAIVLDLPPVAEIAREIIASHGCSDRIQVVAGNYLRDEFSENNDVVLLSGMMHREVPETCRMLLEKARRSMVPGGMVIVSDIMFDDDSQTSPTLATLFALTMMLTSDWGSAHSQTAFLRWMAEAGFEDLKTERLAPPMSHIATVVGRKP